MAVDWRRFVGPAVFSRNQFVLRANQGLAWLPGLFAKVARIARQEFGPSGDIS
jgi:hypothetical protein